MGRGGGHNSHHSNSEKGRNRKSKGRMSYLRRVRKGGGGGSGGGGASKEDEFGQKYGDYEPAYGSKPNWRKGGGQQGYKRREDLRWGMTGFLCTTNFKESDCVREAFNILNEYSEETTEQEGCKESSGGGGQKEELGAMSVDDPIGASKVEKADADGNPEATAADGNLVEMEESATPVKENEEEDIDEALTNELKNLKSERTVRKFQRVDTGVTNVVFISTTIDNPVELAYRIFDDVTAKKQTKSRFLLRLLPVELTCNANNMDEVKTKAKEIVERHMKTGYLSFRIVVNSRLNNKFKKDDFIKTIAELVSQVNPLSFVDLNNAQFTIVAEILKTTLCLGIVKDFTKFKKYNLLEAGSSQTSAQAAGKANQSVPAPGVSNLTENAEAKVPEVERVTGNGKDDGKAETVVVTENVSVPGEAPSELTEIAEVKVPEVAGSDGKDEVKVPEASTVEVTSAE